ncbi:MAG: enolase C-terminal domain-like protein [Xanthobacteraceae bacterium]|uniref:enolase C-terminal domain-like protein n=1 Tax=Pseudolabrys sp. TaxID=1960880 RepID=UPI003D0D07A7
MTATPIFRVREIALYERDVRLRMPFRFGVVTLTEAPQCFVRARIETADGRSAWGQAAEILAPKWFDKNLALSNNDNFDQLRLALRLAASAYTAGDADTAFGHFAAHYDGQIAAGAKHGLNRLVSNFGPAQIDRAVLDALCRLSGVSFYDAMRGNLAGIDPARFAHVGDHASDLAGFDMAAFLGRLSPADSVAARHTVGLVDVIAGHPKQVNDGLPESLEEVAATYGHTYFKLKVGGEPRTDLERLTEIATVLDKIETPYVTSLDGNEQYNDLGALLDLWRRMTAAPALKRLVASIAFIEQPITRAHALDGDISALSTVKPVIIDESDDGLDVFPRAKSLGYAGVSSKCCKGLYKSILNAARCAQWNAQGAPGRYFMTGEDLTTQAGLAVQQDIALINLIGLTHVERNGHHYVNGMMGLPETEQAAFLAAHPDLYEKSHGAVRLRINGGRLQIGSLAAPGFASGASPDWARLSPLAQPAKTVF